MYSAGPTGRAGRRTLTAPPSGLGKSSLSGLGKGWVRAPALTAAAYPALASSGRDREALLRASKASRVAPGSRGPRMMDAALRAGQGRRSSLPWLSRPAFPAARRRQLGRGPT